MLILFTDFGVASPYLGQLKLAAWRRAPTLPIVDLLHDATPFDSQSAAYLLAAFAVDLPSPCALVGVVDPGVGSERDGLIVAVDGRYFVGPDNGLFDRVAVRARSIQCWRIRWRPPRLSNTFHGRDLFTPVATMLLTQQAVPDELGEAIPFPFRDWPIELAQVIYIDAYGNVMIGVRAAALAANSKLRLGNSVLSKARTFAEVPPGRGFWHANSSGLVEIAVNRGRADKYFRLAPGDPVEIDGEWLPLD